MGLAVGRLARRLRQASAGGVTPSQLSALATVSRNGPVTLGALAEQERLAPPTITRIVAKLEDEGWLVRVADPADRRVSLVSTTATGEQLLAEVRRRRADWLEERLAHLDQRDRRRLHAALDALERLADAP
jgi:DNA-binding MarR family transcriptional regulator